MAEYRIISGDSHFVEPPNMWAERVDAKFRDRAPHTKWGHDGREGEFFVCENINPGRGGVWFDPRRVLYGYMRLPQEIQLTFADLTVGGVPERFPRLKLVSAENDISWIPHFMYRLDHAYDRLRHFEGLTLPMLPSEYLKRNVVATFQFETTNVDFTRQIFGAEHIMWSSDYPHTDSPWPRSRDVIAQAFKGIPEQDVQKIVGGNVAKLYNIN